MPCLLPLQDSPKRVSYRSSYLFGDSGIDSCSERVDLRERRHHNWERNPPFLPHHFVIVEKKLQGDTGGEAHMQMTAGDNSPSALWVGGVWMVSEHFHGPPVLATRVIWERNLQGVSLSEGGNFS